MARKRYGFRNHFAKFTRHSGSVDAVGNPTYSDPEQWAKIGATWPCELMSTTAGETLRGRQVTAEATHVLYGANITKWGVMPKDRVTVAGMRLEIVAVLDSDGRGFESRVDARRLVQ